METAYFLIISLGKTSVISLDECHLSPLKRVKKDDKNVLNFLFQFSVLVLGAVVAAKEGNVQEKRGIAPTAQIYSKQLLQAQQQYTPQVEYETQPQQTAKIAIPTVQKVS